MDRDKLLKELEALQKRLEELAAKADLSDDDAAEWDQANDKVEKIQAQIERIDRVAEVKQLSQTPLGRQTTASGPGGEPVRIVNENAFDGKGQFLQAVKAACSNAAGQSDLITRLHKHDAGLRAANGMNEEVSSEGGFLVSEDWSADMRQRMFETGLVLGQVSRQGIGVNSNALAYPMLDESSRAEGTRHGGIRVYYEGEAETITKTKAKVKKGRIPLSKSTALVPVSDELLADAVGLSGWMDREVPSALRWSAENKIFSGSGNDELLGLLNSNALVTVDKEAGQAAGTVVTENVTKMMERCINFSRAGWFITSFLWTQLISLHIKVGTGGTALFVPGGNISGAPFGTLLGRPIYPVEYCKAPGAVGDIILADMSAYLLIEKGAVDQQSSIHVYFETGETAFRWVWRHNGQPVYNSTIEAANGAGEQSEFVALAAR